MFFKKVFIIFIFGLFFQLSSYISQAQTNTSPSIQVIDEMIKIQEAGKKGKTTLERWTEDQIMASFTSLDRAISGDKTYFLKDYKKWVVNNGQGPMPKYALGGALGTGVQMISYLYTPPASGINYIASSWDSILGKPAYAQGFGFTGLQFLLPLWKAFRNIVYILSTIIFVIIGLMIILRVKVSPQAVVTVQSAIPTIITSLVLVTFSYAIAGLLIDLSNLIGGIFMAIIFNIQGIDITTNKSLFTVPGLSSHLGQSWGGMSYKELVNPGLGNLAQLLMSSAPGFSIGLISAQIGGVMIGAVLGGFGNPVGLFPPLYSIGDGIGQVVGGAIGYIILPFLFGIIVGIWVIQLFFGMLTSYVTIIFKIITGPFEIAGGAFPNSKTGFGSWFMDIFANLMVFPIITVFFAILNTISWSINNIGGGVWAPGPISTTMFSADSSVAASLLSSLISIAGLAMASKLPKLIPEFIFMIKPSPFGQAIGDNVKGMYDNVATKFLLDAASHVF